MLANGTRIGSYEIVAPLGAGGMGEVYRARDGRIGRDVAVKVLPADLIRDRDRLARFQQEAQAAGILNHPNLLTIHELGVAESGPYIVSELLEGSTLRQRIDSGPIPQRKAIEYAVQLARGLAAAHERGIIHRDLKPENIFITKDGRVKILDFGLAKLRLKPAPDEETAALQTDPGTVLGSAGYMSPEHIRGEPADARSDIFAFGSVLYEMITSRRAFKGASAVETMNATLTSDPPELESLSLPLSRIVRHCLEKHPEERFQSARDLAFDLEALSDTSSGARAATSTKPKRLTSRLVGALVVAAAVVVLASVAAFLAGKRFAASPQPQYRRVTFRSSLVSAARFAPDQQSVVYSCAADDPSQELYVARLDSPESRTLGVRGCLLGISKLGELAVLLNPTYGGGRRWTGTLARLPLAGGAPREIATNIQEAEWNASGDDLAVIRSSGGETRLEYPIGRVRHQTNGWLSHLRFSSDGKEIAYIDHPAPGDDAGMIALIDNNGARRVLTQKFTSAQGLAWNPDGTEIWFTAADIGGFRALLAIDRAGHLRRISNAPQSLTLQDVDRNGRPLLIASTNRRSILASTARTPEQHDLAWLDFSTLRDISKDGEMIVLDETSAGGGPNYSVYLRKTDGTPAIRIGEGVAGSLSPDGQSVLAIQPRFNPTKLVIYPIGAGETRVITDRFNVSGGLPAWSPDGRSIFFVGNLPNERRRVYAISAAGGEARQVCPDGFLGSIVSPDGQYVAVTGPDTNRYLCPTAGGAPQVVKGLPPTLTIVGWTPDSKALLVFRRFASPIRLMKLDIASGQSELWKEIPAPFGVSSLKITPDGKSYAFGLVNDFGDVYVLDGVR